MCILQIKVVPNSSKSAFDGWYGEALKIRLHAAPEKGEANEELVEFLAEKLGIAKSRIRILSGHTARIKRIEIEGVSLEQIQGII